MKTMLKIAMVAAAVGFAISFGIHVRALLGWPLRSITLMVFHAGVFIVVLPFFWVIRFFQKEQNLRIVPVRLYYKGCPLWMRKVVIGVFVYFLVVMLIFWVKTHGNGGNATLKQWAPPAVVVFFSSGWMGFYSALFAIYFSALRTMPWPVKCPNGHKVPPGRGYCDECGALIPGAVPNGERRD